MENGLRILHLVPAVLNVDGELKQDIGNVTIQNHNITDANAQDLLRIPVLAIPSLVQV